MEKRKKKNLVIVAIICIFCISILSSIPKNYAGTIYIGNLSATSSSASNKTFVGITIENIEQYYGMSITTLNAYLVIGYAGDTAHYKGVILSDNGLNIEATSSNEINATTTLTLYTFTFSSPIPISTFISGNVTFGVICNNTHGSSGWGTYTTGDTHETKVGSVSTYASPLTVSYNIASYSNLASMYLTLTGDIATPTPSPTPNEFQTTYRYSISPTPNYTSYSGIDVASINQNIYYNYTGIIGSNSTPYGNVNVNSYRTMSIYESNDYDNIQDLLNAVISANISDDYMDTGYYSINLNGDAQFCNDLYSEYIFDSYVYAYGIKFNGTIVSTGETFTSFMIILAYEPSASNILQVYLNGGSLVNYKLSETVFNQINYQVQYNASGFILMYGELPTDNLTVYIGTTSLFTDPITVKDASFGEPIIQYTTNGQFSFIITPQAYNSMPLYQGISIFILQDDEPLIGVEYYIEFIGTSNGIFPTPYPTSSNSVINPTPTSSLDLTQFFIMFFLIGFPSLLLAGMCYELGAKTNIHISPVIGFFLGLCIMIPIGYLTPYNGVPLIPLWMLFIFVAVLIIFGVLLFKGIFERGNTPT